MGVALLKVATCSDMFPFRADVLVGFRKYREKMGGCLGFSL